MKNCRPTFLILIPLLALWMCRKPVVVPEPDPETAVPETPSNPSDKTTETAKPVRVTSTSYSIGDGITDPRDSIFIHFDGKIIDSTIPHYDWIPYDDYYWPKDRKIINDTTLVLVFDGKQVNRFGDENDFSFTVTGANGIESDVSVQVPYYHHHILVDGEVDQLSLYNDEKELTYIAHRKLVRLDYLTGTVIREYDLSDLPGEVVVYSYNSFNGMFYLWCFSNSSECFPDIYVLNPDDGSIRLIATIPEEEGAVYQYRQPSSLGFTKNGTGVVTLQCKGSSGSRWKIIRTGADGSMTVEDPVHFPEDNEFWESSVWFFYVNDFTVASNPTGSTLYGYSWSGNAQYFQFDGENCRLSGSFSSPYPKMYAVPHKKDGSWLMQELYIQYVVYPDGTTSSVWDIDSRLGGQSDFCYTPGYDNLIIFLDHNGAYSDYGYLPSRIYFTDSSTGKTVLRKSIKSGMSGFQTTSDGKYGFLYDITYEGIDRYGADHSLIIVYDMPELLSHCRI